MRLAVVAVGVTLAAGGAASSAHKRQAGEASARSGPGGLEAVALTEQAGIGTRIVDPDAEVVDTRAWPATFRGTLQHSDGPAVCSATVIAPRVALTAAHCVGTDGSLTLDHRVGGSPRSWRLSCDIHPAYQQDRSADLALCLSATRISASPYEHLRLDGRSMEPGQRLELLGFGCRRHGQSPDARLWIGSAPLDRLPGTVFVRGQPRPHFAATPPRADGAPPHASLCRGDSGGAAFHSPTDRVRVVAAVNSAYDRSENGVSHLVALWTPSARSFIEGWAERRGQRLCGVHGNAESCR